jgi:hypothetical protein
MTTDDIVRWTARVAVACYLCRVALDVALPASMRNQLARAVWTVGCAIFLAHVAAAFHWTHHWSHAAAFEHTRRQTLELTGWDSGVGLYANYVFAAWWLVDTVAWWLVRNWPPQRVLWATHAYFAFMMFNATVVFGPRGWMVVGTLFIATLACQFLTVRKPNK